MKYCLPFHQFKCVINKHYNLGRTGCLNFKKKQQTNKQIVAFGKMPAEAITDVIQTKVSAKSSTVFKTENRLSNPEIASAFANVLSTWISKDGRDRHAILPIYSI